MFIHYIIHWYVLKIIKTEKWKRSKDLEGGVFGRKGMGVQRAWARCQLCGQRAEEASISGAECKGGRWWMLQESEPDQTLLLALGNTLPSSWVPLMRTLSRVVNREAGDLRCRLFQPMWRRHFGMQGLSYSTVTGNSGMSILTWNALRPCLRCWKSGQVFLW